jgi:hypothetical protein
MSGAQLWAVDFTALGQTIDTQRERVFQVSAILACLGNVLDDVYAPGAEAPDLQKVTDTAIWMLDRIAARLDPTLLRRDHTAIADSTASAVADGLREAATQCRSDQPALQTRLIEAAHLIERLIGRDVQP